MSNYENSSGAGYSENLTGRYVVPVAAVGTVHDGPYQGNYGSGSASVGTTYDGGSYNSAGVTGAAQQYGEQSMGSSDRTGGMQQQGYRQESSSQSQSQSSDNYGSSSRTGGAQQYGEGGYGTAGQGHDTQQSGYREGQSNQYGGGGSSNYDSSLPAGGQGRSARKSGLDGTSVARGGASGYGGNDSKDYKSSLLQKDYDETKGGSRLGDAAGAQYSNQGQGYDNQSQGYDNRSGGTQDTYADQKLTGEEPGYKMVEANVAGKLHGQTAAEGDGSYGDLRNDDTTDGYGASRNSVDEGAHSGKRKSTSGGLMHKVTHLLHKS